jgi:hypothetical protein
VQAAWILDFDENGPKERRHYYDLFNVIRQIGA